MIPQGSRLGDTPIGSTEQPSLTYRLDLATMEIVGTVDGLEAVKQAVFKILSTERFAHEIYSAAYGTELDRAVGSDSTTIRTELVRCIRDALIRGDDRIRDVEDMEIEQTGDSALVTFTVISTYGSYTDRLEVGTDV